MRTLFAIIVLLGSSLQAFGQDTPYFETGLGSGTPSLGDLNDDGRLDLAFAVGTSVYIRFNLGNGQFGPFTTVPIGDPPIIEIADVDGDRLGDLVVFEGSELVILRGDGVGGFEEIDRRSTTSSPRVFAVDDLDGDGDPDVAMGGNLRLNVFLNDGLGQFDVFHEYLLVESCQAIAVEDLDGNGSLDLALALMPSFPSVALYFGHGDGSFEDAVFLPTTNPTDIAIGEITGDAHLDIVTGAAQSNSQDVHVMAGNGDGTFEAPFGVDAGGIHPSRLLLRDMNEDGRLDLLALAAHSRWLAILPGRETGLFDAPKRHVPSFAPSGLRAGDLNLDGDLDVVIYGSRTDVFWGIGNGSAVSGQSLGFSPRTVTLDDFNEDGHLDAVVAHQGPSGDEDDLALLFGDGRGAFTPRTEVFARRGQGDLISGDFDEDGHADIIVQNELGSDDGNTLLRGHGDGTFAPAWPIDHELSVLDHLMSADFDGDGHLDLVQLMGSSFYTPHVLLGHGDGTFAPPVSVGDPGPSSYVSVAIGDFDGDTIPDLVAHKYSSIEVFLGRGDGTFEDAIHSEMRYIRDRMTTGDFDNDGRTDVAVAHYSGIGVFLGRGDGTFDSQRDFFSTIDGPWYLHTADVNNDGIDDVIGTGEGQGHFDSPLLQTWLGTNGNAMEEVIDSWQTATRGSAVGDIDGDGVDDVAIVRFTNLYPLLSRHGPWRNLESGLGTADRSPTLRGRGTLQPHADFELHLDDARPSNPLTYLVIGLTRLDVPFRGGHYLPFPNFQLNWPTDATGSSTLAGSWPADIPPALELYYQVWMVDPAGPSEFLASNGLLSTTPE